MQLLKAKLPAWVKLVWIAIRSFQGSNNHCFANLKTIGERVPNERGNSLDKSQVSRAVNKLKKEGFLEVDGRKKLRCTTPQKVVAESTFSIENSENKLQLSQRLLQLSQPKVAAESTNVVAESTPSENQKGKPKTKTKKEKGSKVFSPDSWQYQISAEHFGILKALQIAPRRALQNAEKTIQNGAAIFDKLERLDGHTQDEIYLVLGWLLTPQNWWVKTANYASASKLRDKKNDQTYFEKFLIEARQKNGKSGTAKSDGNSTYSPATSYARIHSIAAAALNPEQRPMGSTGTD